MSAKYSATRILHEDHMASLALMNDVARVIVGRKTAPARDDDQTIRFADRLSDALEGEISAHFDFEEQALFPLLAEYGDGELGDLLIEEHNVLRDVMRDIVALTRFARDQGFTEEGWGKLRRLCGELIERLQSHIDKEEQALAQSLDNALTPETDAEVCARYDR